MGCCESNEERGNVQMATVPYSKTYRVGEAYKQNTDNVSFEDTEPETVDGINYDLYSDFSEDDTHSDNGEATDWEDLSTNVSLKRVGNSKEMFLKAPLKHMLKHANYTVKDIFQKLGAFRVKPTDIPTDIAEENLEFRCEIKNLGPEGFYLGQWRKDTNTKEGRGIWINPKKEIYEGFWFNGKQSGMGRFINSEGDVYQGQWKNGNPDGYGILKNNEGMIYKGQWAKYAPHGQGYEIWADGTCYYGEFKKGAKNGEGHYKWIDESEYKGEVKNDKLHGDGIYTWKDGRSYSGCFKNNKMHGRGVFRWADGKVYQGHFINDNKEGEGEMSWPDGRRYIGEWKKGKQHGIGTMIDQDNKSKIGEFIEGNPIRWIKE